MEIILVRHGECSTNGCYTGRESVVPLNKEGILQIETISSELKIRLKNKKTKLYSSNLIRAKQSANIISKQLGNKNIISDNRIDEISFGKWEGLNYEQIMSKWEKLATNWYNNPLTVTPPNGEEYDHFLKRVTDFKNEVIGLKDYSQTETFIIVTHGGVIQLLSALLNSDTIENRWSYDIARGEYRMIVL